MGYTRELKLDSDEFRRYVESKTRVITVQMMPFVMMALYETYPTIQARSLFHRNNSVVCYICAVEPDLRFYRHVGKASEHRDNGGGTTKREERQHAHLDDILVSFKQRVIPLILNGYQPTWHSALYSPINDLNALRDKVDSLERRLDTVNVMMLSPVSPGWETRYRKRSKRTESEKDEEEYEWIEPVTQLDEEVSVLQGRIRALSEYLQKDLRLKLKKLVIPDIPPATGSLKFRLNALTRVIESMVKYIQHSKYAVELERLWIPSGRMPEVVEWDADE